MQAELLALLKRTLATITGRENLSIKGLCTWKLNNYSTVPSFLSVGVLPPLSEIFHSALFQGVDVHLFQTDFQKISQWICLFPLKGVFHVFVFHNKGSWSPWEAEASRVVKKIATVYCFIQGFVLVYIYIISSCQKISNVFELFLCVVFFLLLQIIGT